MRRVNKMQALRTFLLAALLTASLSCSTVFYSAKASGGQDTVSKSDAVTGSDMIIETIMEDVGSKRLLFKKNAVYNGSFRSELFEDELLIYDALYEQCITNRSNASVEIDFSGLGYTSDDSDCIRDMMKSAFFAFAYDHPEVYWIRSFSSSQWKSGGYITKLQITPTEAYPNAFDDIDVVYSGITAAVNEINSTRASASRYDTAKAIHDYICHHASYDYDVLSGGAYAGDHAEDQTVAPLFGGGRRGSKFVCEGYSESFKLLCDRFNVPCVHLLSENHAWNYVQMEDGNWYAVDVTWDDSTTIHYRYFLVGANTPDPSGVPFSQNHQELTYYFQSDTIEPFAYPPLSGEKYSIFDFWGDCAENGREISGYSEFWWKYNSLIPSGCDVNVSIDGTHLATVQMDNNRYFSYTLDTARYENGQHTVSAVYRGTDGTEITVSRTVVINNAVSGHFFGFWDWSEENPAVAGDFRVWLKQQNYGDTSNCDVNLYIDGKHRQTLYCDSDGFFSYVIDTTQLNNGVHLLKAVFRNTNDVEIEEEKYFRIENPSFTVWDWNQDNPTVSGTYKVWMKQEYCGSADDHDVNVYIDDVHYQTLLCDDNGFFSYDIDTAALSNGSHTFKAILRTKSGLEMTDVRDFTVQNGVTLTSIAVKNASETVMEGNQIQLLYTLIPSNASNVSVTWTSSDTSVATVSSEGLVKGIKAGTAVITVSAGELSAACTVTVQAKPVTYPVKLSKSALQLTITDNVQRPSALLSAKKPTSIRKVVWCSDNPEIATVTQSGRVTACASGKANIYCKSVTGEILSQPCEVSVRAFLIDTSDFFGNERFTVYNNVRCLPNTDSGTLDIFDSDYSTDQVIWKSSNPGVISIDKNGFYRCCGKKGTVTVTAVRGSVKTSIKLRAYQPTESLKLNYSDVSVYIGKSLTLKAIQSKGADEPVFWESLNASVVTVSPNGVLKGISQGTASIRAYTPGGRKTETTVHVRTRATGFTWVTVPAGMSPRSAVRYGIGVGSTKDLYASITSPANCNDTVTWTTSNQSVVSIDASLDNGNGVRVRGLKKGTANITAKTGSGKKITYTVSVVPQPAQQIVLNRNAVSLYKGAAVSLSARVLAKGSNDVVIWKSSDASVATVSESGRVTAVSQGTAQITAYSSFSGAVCDRATVYVMTKATGFTWDTVPNGMTPRSTVRYALGLDEEMDLAVNITAPENCNDTISWSTSNRGAVAVYDEYDANNVVRIRALKKGVATVTAKTGSGKKVTYQISVVDQGGQDILLNRHAAVIYKGNFLALSAKVTPKGNIVLWSSSDPDVARVDENGRITAVSNGTATITAYFSYQPGYYDQTEITVITKAASVDVSEASVSLAAGQSKVVTAAVSPAGCGDRLNWSSSNNAVATVTASENGSATIKAIKHGQCIVMVRTGSGKYKKITVTVTR